MYSWYLIETILQFFIYYNCNALSCAVFLRFLYFTNCYKQLCYEFQLNKSMSSNNYNGKASQNMSCSSHNTLSTNTSTTENNINEIDPNKSIQNKSSCPHCGKFYTRVNTHISRSHPEIHRLNILSRQKDKIKDLTITKQDSVDRNKDNADPISDIPLEKYKDGLTSWLNIFSGDLNDEQFNNSVTDFANFLSKSIDFFPGPKHPAKKYFEYRKAKRDITIQRGYQSHSNPQRANKRDREKRRNKFLYDEIQFLYYNQRRKAVRKVLSGGAPPSCKRSTKDIYDHFSELFSTVNNKVRESYDNCLTDTDRLVLDETFDPIISKNDIITAMRGIAVDTAPGPDGVLMRVLKDDIACAAMSKIATRMLQTGYVPSLFKKARSVLIFKKGHEEDLSNWRPITICSLLRRIIERSLDTLLKKYVEFSEHQRGFTRSPGCIMNTALLRTVLQSAKSAKRNCTVVFLDIRKAFDNVGHSHLRNTLSSSSLPIKLSELIFNLQENCTTSFQIENKRSQCISFKRGVMQGSPLSPSLYNLATDHIFRELSENEISSHYGFRIADGLSPLSILGFADDTVLIGNNKESAKELTRMALQRFQEIGLEISADKCVAINIVNGKIAIDNLEVLPEVHIRCITPNESIKYLGINFADSVVFNSRQMMTELKQKLDLLSSSPWLKADQKFNILNSSVCPVLIYPFMSVPIEKIPNNSERNLMP